MKYVSIVAALLLVACGKNEPPQAAPVTPPVAKAPVAAPLRAATKVEPLQAMPGALENGDFEQAGVGGEIPGWSSSQHAGPTAFTMRVDAKDAYAGSGSLHVTRTQPSVYGSIAQTLDAKVFAGKTVALSAMLKTQNVGPKGWQLYINAGLPGTMRVADALSGDTPWRRVSVQVKVPPGARYLTVGATLRDAGDGWMDNVELKTLD